MKQQRLLEMLFLRDFVALSGGHLKHADYIRHTLVSGRVDPVLYQTPRSSSGIDNIFREFSDRCIGTIRPSPAYFIAGTDWFMLDEAGIDPVGVPVINLIQDFRYADSSHPVHACLRRPALRICVSEPLAAAVRADANGEVHVIRNGVDLAPASVGSAATPRVLIAGLKNPQLATAVAARLDGVVDVDLLVHSLPRPAFLERIAQAMVCVLLPLPREGFYLPPLEAMSIGRAVVTTDCEGNRLHCRHEDNCLIAATRPDDLAAAAVALVRDAARRRQLVEAGRTTAAVHSLDNERKAYLEILDRYLDSFL